MPLRPCGVCRTPVPDGQCPKHPRDRGGYRPARPSVVSGAYGAGWQAVRLPVLVRDRFTCQYCGAPRAKTADHVIPHSKGGTRALTNLVAACPTCNTSKGDRTLTEWIATGLAPARAFELLKSRVSDGLTS